MVTPQALSLLNGEETNDRALAFAIRILKDSKNEKGDHDPQTIVKLYRLAYGRSPSRIEIANVIQAWKDLTGIEATISYQPRKYPTTVTRTANEENTGELFTFTEELIEYRNYIADAEPHKADARTRGLANICLAILNSNEFMFVD